MLTVFLTFLLRIINPRYRSIEFIFVCDGATHKAKHMNTNINDAQKFSLTIQLTSAAGSITAPQSAPTWSSSDPSIVTVTPAADGLSAEVQAVRAGQTTITATVDGLSASDDITITAGPAATLTLVAGDPVAI